MRIWRITLLTLIHLSFFLSIQAQNISNEGTDFWSVFPTHDPAFYLGLPKLANNTIYVSSKNNSEVTVTCGAWSQTKKIMANVVEPFLIPRADAYVDLKDINTVKVQKGIHITVTAGMPKVAVYSHIYAGRRSSASLILPTDALGPQYFSMNYTQNGNINDGAGRNYLAIVATEPNTKIIIHTREGKRSVSFNNAGEVYEYMPPDQRDLTGTIVEIDPLSPDNCNKRFAVFSGNTSVSIGKGSPDEDSRDPLYQQLYPPTSWGKNYSVVPFKDRKFLLRILAQEDNTRVDFNGGTFILNKGQFYESPSLLMESLFIKANKKISVAQYSLSQIWSSATNLEMLSDPDMVLLNPIEFNVKAITLFSSTKERISERYINVSMKTSVTSTFKIDGAAPENGTWSVIPSNPEYSCIQIRISNVSSTLTANDGFNAIAYGFGEKESYSYSAGTNLAADNYLLIHNQLTNTDSKNACVGQKSNFKIVLPYKALSITWDLEGYSPIDYTPEPQIIPTPDGPSYAYLYNRDFIFDELGKLKMQITAVRPNENNCLSAEIEYDFDFDINPVPTPIISLDPEGFVDSLISFTDLSNSNLTDKPLNKWLWDFGDDQVSTAQNPTHIYRKPGDFTVRFFTGRDDGCMSEVITKVIRIRTKINYDSTDICPPNAFSPNDDKINDTWIIDAIETYPDVTVEVFTRYGARVFFSSGYSVPFDGKFKGEALPVGTYYYIIDPNNGTKRVTGALTLLK